MLLSASLSLRDIVTFDLEPLANIACGGLLQFVRNPPRKVGSLVKYGALYWYSINKQIHINNQKESKI